MKYRHKMKLQEAAKVKGQKRRVADRSERPQYTDEEVAKLIDYDYGCLLDMIYYKLESMRDFFLSKHTHGADAKKMQSKWRWPCDSSALPKAKMLSLTTRTRHTSTRRTTNAMRSSFIPAIRYAKKKLGMCCSCILKIGCGSGGID